MDTRRFHWLLLLLVVALGCPATTSNRSGRSYSSEDGDEEGEGGEGGGDGGDEGGDEGDGEERVKLKFKALSDAVTENSSSGRPRQSVRRLREKLCDGYEDSPKIFYHLIVSSHYHYYWICSDDRARRQSTKSGKKNLTTWLRNFQRQAQSESRTCAAGSSSKILTGHRHESGIEGTAYCDGRLVITYPDGTTSRKSFDSEAGRGGGGGGGGGGGEEGGGEGGGDEGSAGRNCPPCPTVTTRGKCPDCPRCDVCPPPKPCPACPPKDCRAEIMNAGKAGFKQGIDKACKRICDLIYKKCRSIDQKTAMCYTLSEYCASECSK